jgi:hypothetical protein
MHGSQNLRAKGGKLDEISAKNGLTGLIITPKE